ASQIGLFGGVQSVAPSLGVDVRPIDTRDVSEIERAIAAFAGEPNGGLIAASGSGVLRHRELIVALATRHRLPAVYAYRSHVMSGGLAFFGPHSLGQFLPSAPYVHLILKGGNTAALTVQFPTH